MRIGIDLGGTNISVGLVDESGKIIEKLRCKTYSNRGSGPIIEDMINQVKTLINRNNLTLKDLSIIGIGVPGLVDYSIGRVEECVNLHWKNIYLREEILKHIIKEINIKLELKILIENDANAAAVGEYLFGSMKGNKNSLLMTLGTGIGGGLILNGQLFRGRGAALEIGHMAIGKNFYNCSCGNNGCFETFASATAIAKYAQKLIIDGKESKMMEYVNGDISKIDTKTVFRYVEQEDEVAELAIKRFLEYMAIGMNNIINILDLDLIAIGGGVAEGIEIIKSKLIEEVKKRKLYKNIELCKIERAVLGNDAGIIGAAMLDKI